MTPAAAPTMTPVDHAARRARLVATLAQEELDALLVTALLNVRYLSGFTGSNAALLVTRELAGHAVMATDGRYVTQAGTQSADLDLVVDRACAPALVAWAVKHGLRRVGIEARTVTLAVLDVLRTAASEVPGLALVPLDAAVESLRTIKDDAELSLIAQACAISDQALSELWGTVAVGRTERDVAHELEHRMHVHGAEAPAFATIVAGGPHSAIPHHQPTDRPLERGDLLKIDFGARVGGYHADMTRTVVVGAPPAPWQQEIHDLVAAAQRAGRDALAPGAAAVDVDAAARTVIAQAGHGSDFPHGLGHGVGLQIHEAPMIGATADGRVQCRVPVTVEPGVYLPGRGGVRIEDTLIVRDGGPQLLTTATRELLVLGT
jgi:Xaa-Pro aminopeptidase